MMIPETMVVMRMENGGLCCTGMCSADSSTPFPFNWDYVSAQIAMMSPQAQALKPGESFNVGEKDLK